MMAAGFACAPLYLKAPENLTNKKSALNGGQIMRGAYINSGSHDAGADPNWVNGVYVPSTPAHFKPSADDVADARVSLESRKRAAGMIR